MITTVLNIVGFLLGCGIVGILIIIGAISVIGWIIKQIVVNIYYAIHSDKRFKGGD